MKINKAIFKTNDVRGRYPSEINEEAACTIGKALANHWKSGPIVIARDARLSSPTLYDAIIAGLKTFNLELITVGLATTPMFYFTVVDKKAVGGIMVTASHNPKEYNGLKIVGYNAEVISGQDVMKFLQ